MSRQDVHARTRLLPLVLCMVTAASQLSPSRTAKPTVVSITATSTASSSITATSTASPSITATSTASPTATVTPCTLHKYPTHDMIGTPLLVNQQRSEQACLFACCVDPQCVGYSFNARLLGTESVVAAADVTATSVESAYEWPIFSGGCVGLSRSDNKFMRGGIPTQFNGGGSQWNGYCGEAASSPVVSAGTTSQTRATITSAPCVLLSNITQLVPTNGWNSGLKPSALSS